MECFSRREAKRNQKPEIRDQKIVHSSLLIPELRTKNPESTINNASTPPTSCWRFLTATVSLRLNQRFPMSEFDSRDSLDSRETGSSMLSGQVPPSIKPFQKTAQTPFFFQKIPWVMGFILGCLDLCLWMLIYYALSKITGSYNHITIGAFLVPAAIMMTAVGLIGGYRSTTDFASLQYASEHFIACGGSFPLVAFFLYVVASFGNGPASSRVILLLSSVLFAGASLLCRRFFYFSSLKIRQESKFLVIADEDLGAIFYDDYLSSGQYQWMHFVAVHESQREKAVAGKNSLIIHEGLAQLPALFEKESIATFTAVVIAARFSELDQEIAQKLLLIHFNGIPVYSMGNFYEVYWNRLPLEFVGPDWIIEANLNLVRHSFPSLLKRFFDLLIALCLLLLLAPFMLLVAVAIFFIDGRPVIFSQQRVGLHQIPFTLYKFRTMMIGSDCENLYTQEGDQRVSRLGSLLRKTRLDELPQLWNVIRGEMSLIGPRAEWTKLVQSYEQVIPHYHLRHLIRPGITGWAQVKYPYGSSLDDTLQKLSYDLYYIRNYSFKLDASVLLKTIYVIVFGKGR